MNDFQLGGMKKLRIGTFSYQRYLYIGGGFKRESATSVEMGLEGQQTHVEEGI